MRVPVTIPAYLVPKFEQLMDELGLSKQDTLLHCLTESVTRKTAVPSGATAHMLETPDPEVPDLFMLAPPERLKVYTFNDRGSCLRAEEIGEYHEIEHGDRYAWQKFSRHSKKDVEGWEQGKNGKLCESCHAIALRLWEGGDKSFSQ